MLDPKFKFPILGMYLWYNPHPIHWNLTTKCKNTLLHSEYKAIDLDCIKQWPQKEIH